MFISSECGKHIYNEMKERRLEGGDTVLKEWNGENSSRKFPANSTNMTYKRCDKRGCWIVTGHTGGHNSQE